MVKHNKKRNVGIIYELLLNYISTNIIEGNNFEAKKASKIVERHFKKGTELYKEFKLFNALANSEVKNTHVVASILNEAKNAVRNNIDSAKLEKEKSILIKNIKNYRELGTIQTAINEWKSNSNDLTKMALLESKIVDKMLSEDKNTDNFKNIDVDHTDRLVYKIMIEKFNNQYKNSLNIDQKEIIKNYVFYKDKNEKMLQEMFERKKDQSIALLNDFEDRSKNKYLLSKVDNVRSKINEVNSKNVNDNTIVKFLTLTKLIEEITKEE
jgi:hypothetical protein